VAVDRLPPPTWVEVGAAAFPVLEVGDPDGRPAVLVPGLTDGLAPITQPRTREVLAEVPLPLEHLRGLLLSHRFPISPPVTTRMLAEDIAGLLRTWFDEPAVLLCHSMGAMVAQHLAVDHPDLVAGMVLSATVARVDEELRATLTGWEALVRAGRFREFGLEAIRTSFTGEEAELRRALLEASPAEDPDVTLVDRHLALTGACVAHDALDRLGRVRCPTLVLAGELDPVAPPHHAHQLAEAIPGAELEVFDGLAHGFPEQAPERFTARVGAFLAAIDRPVR
jgi:pimeloyl-ACP methyl ester carboxylesterase